ncbi:MAG: hypothetical protein QW171_03655 [Candidatus Bilamarchaeaceae archaeon]
MCGATSNTLNQKVEGNKSSDKMPGSDQKRSWLKRIFSKRKNDIEKNKENEGVAKRSQVSYGEIEEEQAGMLKKIVESVIDDIRNDRSNVRELIEAIRSEEFFKSAVETRTPLEDSYYENEEVPKDHKAAAHLENLKKAFLVGLDAWVRGSNRFDNSPFAVKEHYDIFVTAMGACERTREAFIKYVEEYANENCELTKEKGSILGGVFVALCRYPTFGDKGGRIQEVFESSGRTRKIGFWSGMDLVKHCKKNIELPKEAYEDIKKLVSEFGVNPDYEIKIKESYCSSKKSEDKASISKELSELSFKYLEPLAGERNGEEIERARAIRDALSDIASKIEEIKSDFRGNNKSVVNQRLNEIESILRTHKNEFLEGQLQLIAKKSVVNEKLDEIESILRIHKNEFLKRQLQLIVKKLEEEIKRLNKKLDNLKGHNDSNDAKKEITEQIKKTTKQIDLRKGIINDIREGKDIRKNEDIEEYKKLSELDIESTIETMERLILGLKNYKNENVVEEIGELEKKTKELRLKLFPYEKICEKIGASAKKMLNGRPVTAEDYRTALGILYRQIKVEDAQNSNVKSDSKLLRLGRKDVSGWFFSRADSAVPVFIEEIKQFKQFCYRVFSLLRFKAFSKKGKNIDNNSGNTLDALMPTKEWRWLRLAPTLPIGIYVVIRDATLSLISGTHHLVRKAGLKLANIITIVTSVILGYGSYYMGYHYILRIDKKTHRDYNEKREIVLDKSDGKLKWAYKDSSGKSHVDPLYENGKMAWIKKEVGVRIREGEYYGFYGITDKEKVKWLDDRPAIAEYFERKFWPTDTLITLSEWKSQEQRGNEKSKKNTPATLSEQNARKKKGYSKNQYILNKMKAENFIEELMEEEKKGKMITKDWLELNKPKWIEKRYLVTPKVNWYMVTYNLNARDAEILIKFIDRSYRVIAEGDKENWVLSMLNKGYDDFHIKDVKKFVERIKKTASRGRTLKREDLVDGEQIKDTAVIERYINLKREIGEVPSETYADYLYKKQDRIKWIKKYKEMGYDTSDLNKLLAEIKQLDESDGEELNYYNPFHNKFNIDYLLDSGLLKKSEALIEKEKAEELASTYPSLNTLILQYIQDKLNDLPVSQREAVERKVKADFYDAIQKKSQKIGLRWKNGKLERDENGAPKINKDQLKKTAISFVEDALKKIDINDTRVTSTESAINDRITNRNQGEEQNRGNRQRRSASSTVDLGDF